MNELAEGTIIVPYMKDSPLILFENQQEGSTDSFIRAQKHTYLEVWYADVDGKAENGVSRPRDPNENRLIGAIIFVTANEIRIGQGVRITRVFKDGKSARGVIVKLPTNVSYPYDHDTRNLFKPVPKEQTT